MVVGWGVGLELAEVPDSTGWGWPLALPYFDMVAGVAALALDPGFALI